MERLQGRGDQPPKGVYEQNPANAQRPELLQRMVGQDVEGGDDCSGL